MESWRKDLHLVNRRTGGLEIFSHPYFPNSFVNRRTGGLENHLARTLISMKVNRRIGGLEI